MIGDPWNAVRPLSLEQAGPEALLMNGIASRAGLWAGQGRLFGISELREDALALGLERGPWLASASLRGMTLDIYRLRELRTGLCWRQPGFGILLALLWQREGFSEGPALDRQNVLLAAGGSVAGLDLQLGLLVPLVEAGSMRQLLAAACSFPLGHGFRAGYRLSELETQPGVAERYDVAWTRGRTGLALSWLPGRGIWVAGMLRLKRVTLSLGLWQHPVLPMTPAWGVGLIPDSEQDS